MKTDLLPRLSLLGAALILLSTVAHAQTTPVKNLPRHGMDDPEVKTSVAYRWAGITQEATVHDIERTAPRPTIISRTMAIWATAAYDAWAAYDEKAVGTRLGDKLRRPKNEHTLANKEKAISYASYHATLYTQYRPVNPPDRIIDPDRWQPSEFTLPDGKKVTPGFLPPHWYRVKPFALESSKQFRPSPPPMTTTDDDKLKQETDAVLKYNNSLTNEQKAVVEFMRDGPRSTAQSGHWLKFAQDVSRRDKNDLDRDVKLFFAITNTAMDAFISCWETKRYYDSSRPWTLIRHYYGGKKIIGWAGSDGGTKEMDGNDWHPYSPASFNTPPFPYFDGTAKVREN